MVVNGIVSLISFSDSLLLVYRNNTYFCILIFYPATLPNSFLSSSGFLVAYLGFPMYSIRSSVNRDSFTSFPTWTPFISFSCLIVVTWASNAMLNKSGNSGHPCLVPDFRGNAFSLL